MDKNMISAKRNIPGIIILSQEKYCFVFTKIFFLFLKNPIYQIISDQFADHVVDLTHQNWKYWVFTR